jgi:hypothetical protein
MTVFSATSPQSPRTRTRAHVVPIVLGSAAAMCAIALVAYLLWPTWGPSGANAPDKLPVSIGGTLFNLPTAAIRMKIQRHSGPQERIDLDFLYPSLEPPGAPKHVTADSVDAAMQPIDRIFLSIAAHRDALSPEQRSATIYPRYLDQAAATPEDGLTMRIFRADTPYGSEDLFCRKSRAHRALRPRRACACPNAASAAPTSPSAFRGAGSRNGETPRKRWTG